MADWQSQLEKDLAKKYNLDYRIIREIVRSPLKFVKRRMEDEEDQRPIRLRYFGVFVQKEMVNKPMVNKGRITEMCKNIRRCAYTKKELNTMYDNGEFAKIKAAYVAWKYKVNEDIRHSTR